MTIRFYPLTSSTFINHHRSQPAPLAVASEPKANGDYLFTLIAAILLSTCSIVCLASGTAKFSRTLTLSTQTQVEVPEQTTRQARRYLD